MCSDDVNGYACACTPGYKGKLCQGDSNYLCFIALLQCCNYQVNIYIKNITIINVVSISLFTYRFCM